MSELRVAEEKDQDSIVNVTNEAFMHDSFFKYEEYYLRFTLANVKAHMTKDNSVFLLYEEETTGNCRTIVGSIWLKWTISDTSVTGSFSAVSVLNSHTKKGIGRKLVSGAEKFILNLNYADKPERVMQAGVVNVREFLFGWYKKQGYKVVSEIRDDPEINMIKLPDLEVYLVIIEKILLKDSKHNESENENNENKIIYLIRHAESEQNIALDRLRDGDYSALFRIAELGLDAPLSEVGKSQLAPVHNYLSKNAWNPSRRGSPCPEIIAHSPYKRASATARGIFGGCDDIPMFNLPCFHEKTLWEYAYEPSLDSRIAETETWLRSRPEAVIAMVGHGQFFKRWLGLSESPDNTEILECLWSESSIELVDRYRVK
jgi:ribosomal protein S18 acetylase RimI-like enzyme